MWIVFVLLFLFSSMVTLTVLLCYHISVSTNTRHPSRQLLMSPSSVAISEPLEGSSFRGME